MLSPAQRPDRDRVPRHHRAAVRAFGGAWVFAGHQMTGYTDEEESQGGPRDVALCTLESRLRAEGTKFAAGARKASSPSPTGT